MLEQFKIDRTDLAQILNDGGVWDVPFKAKKKNGIKCLAFSVRGDDQMSQFMDILGSFHLTGEEYLLKNSPELLERVKSLGLIRALGPVLREEVNDGESVIYYFPALTLK